MSHDSGDTDPTSVPTAAEPIWASLQIKRGAQGKMWLHVEAKELHDRLRAMGATVDPVTNTFMDGPQSSYDCTDKVKLMSKVFLKCEYPASFPISDQWASGTPPTLDQLTAVCATGEATVKKILAHFQPVDIRLKIKRG